MKAITLYQPWASLVAIGAKTIETRSWGTAHRGPLLIHAARRWTAAEQFAYFRSRDALVLAGWSHPRAEYLRDGKHLGCIVAVSRLADCREMREAPDGLDGRLGTYGPGRYGWVLEDVRPLPTPVPWPGERRLWDVPEKLADLVVSQVGEV